MFTSVLKFVLILLPVIILTGFNEPSMDDILFSIKRNRDANEIFYFVNTVKNGKLHPEEPIKVLWLKKDKQNKYEPLTWVQHKFAYGLVYISRSETEAEFRFAGYDKNIFKLKKHLAKGYRVFTVHNGREIKIDHLFIYITGGSFWVPEISKVELHASIPGTNIKIKKTITQ